MQNSSTQIFAIPIFEAMNEAFSKRFLSILTLLMAICFFFPIFLTSAQTYSTNPQEFAGPFASWVNLKTKYGAKGNGVSDDTHALQRALNEIGAAGETDTQVLYIPAGTYRITTGLTLSARTSIAIIGEDPATTTIKWYGSTGGKMLHVNGVSYSRFARLTWDGSGKANVAIAQQWNGSTGFGPTHNEYADEVFVNVGYGIRAGIPHNMDAETSVTRCRFIRNSVAGVSLESFNALDWFIQDCYFEDCRVGVTNDPPTGGAGNFHVYHSLFKRSTYADITIKNTMYFSIRDNYSVGSRAFFIGDPIGQNGALTTLQNNIIVQTQDRTAIRINNKGPVTMLDNVIISKAAYTTGPIVQTEADLTTVGNRYTAANAVVCTGKWIAIDEVVQGSGAAIPSELVLAGTPSKKKRRIFELMPGWNGEQFQQLIDSAVALAGQRPIIHMRPGAYSLLKTIVIPAGADLQLIGDGYDSAIKWFGPVGGEAIRLEGADQLLLEDFTIFGNYKQRGIGLAIKHSDQADKRILMDGLHVWDGQSVGLLMEGFRHTNVELHNFYHFGNPNVSVRVNGGGASSTGRLNIFGGASSDNGISYDVTKGGSLMAQDIWYEGNSPKGFVNLTGSGRFTLNGANIYTVNAPTVPVAVNNFKGKATFLGITMNGKLAVQGGTTTQALVMGMQFDNTPNAFSKNSTTAKAAMLNSRLYRQGSYPLDNIGTADPAFIRQMLEQVRSERPAYRNGATGLIVHRVQVAQTQMGIHIMPLAAIPSTPACVATGSISQEYWSQVTGNSVTVIPLTTVPTSTSRLSSFETPSTLAEDYGQRIRGYLCAPQTGNYTFYIASNDNSDLYLSTDDQPTNKRKIASVTTFTQSRQWNKYASQQSVSLALQAGKSYYIEALHKQGKKTDHFAVGWQLPNTTAIAVIPGKYLSPFVASAGRLASDESPTEDNLVSWQVYPNPSSGETVHIAAQGLESEEEGTVTLYNSIGEKVATQVWKADEQGTWQKEWPVAGKPAPGIYILRMENNRRRVSQKLLIAR